MFLSTKSFDWHFGFIWTFTNPVLFALRNYFWRQKRDALTLQRGNQEDGICCGHPVGSNWCQEGFSVLWWAMDEGNLQGKIWYWPWTIRYDICSIFLPRWWSGGGRTWSASATGGRSEQRTSEVTWPSAWSSTSGTLSGSIFEHSKIAALTFPFFLGCCWLDVWKKTFLLVLLTCPLTNLPSLWRISRKWRRLPTESTGRDHHVALDQGVVPLTHWVEAFPHSQSAWRSSSAPTDGPQPSTSGPGHR